MNISFSQYFTLVVWV